MPRITLREQLANARYRAETAERRAEIFEERLQYIEEVATSLQSTLVQLGEATQGVVPSFKRQGNVTICTLGDPFSERVYVGAAVCNLTDTFDIEIGKAISLGRAMADRADYFAAHAVASKENR